MCLRVLAESELSLPQRLSIFKLLERLCTIFMDNDAEASIALGRTTPPESRVHFLLCKTFVKAYLQEKRIREITKDPEEEHIADWEIFSKETFYGYREQWGDRLLWEDIVRVVRSNYEAALCAPYRCLAAMGDVDE
uniref:Uncharacterized protein n=1 Tax=Parascaris equorum TaxID=6256 RepID=A0A914RD12_PAREQ